MKKEMTTKEIIEQIKQDLKNNIIKVVSADGYRYYTDTQTESVIVPLTTVEDTAEAYYKLMIAPHTSQAQLTIEKLPRVSMFVGQPDTGKTYKAIKIAEELGIEPIFKMCNDSVNLETLLKDFVLRDGKPSFEESLTIQALSGDEPAIIILDEFNTLLTGVMKTLQPLFDDTSTHFEYAGKIYKKNPNCKFIVTLNDKDKGISVIPDAILSRCAITYFDPVDLSTLSKWTGYDLTYVTHVYNIFKTLGILNIFGTRQLKILRDIDLKQRTQHLIGLCVLRNLDANIVNQIEIQSILTKL